MRDSAATEARTRGIGFYLVALIMLAVVPLVVIAGVLVLRLAYLQRQAFEQSLTQTAVALSVAVDRQLDSYRVMLETLAQADELKLGRIDAFHALSTRAAAKHGALFVSLFDSDGNQIFNTLRPPGEPLPTPFRDPRVGADDPDRPPVGDPSALRRVLETGRAVNSDLLFGLVAGRLLFTMNVPVLENGKVAYVLNAAFTPDVMTKLLQDNPRFSGVPAVIFDRQGFIVGRWKDAEKFTGQRVGGWSFIRAQHADSGVNAGTTLEGIPVHYSFARSRNSGWGVNVGVERTAMESAARMSWIVGGTLAAAGLFLGVLLALLVASR